MVAVAQTGRAPEFRPLYEESLEIAGQRKVKIRMKCLDKMSRTSVLYV
jgi:hypothetical protein